MVLRRLAQVSALLAATALALPSVAAARALGSETSDSFRVALEIDASALPPSRTGGDVVDWLAQTLGETLSEAGVLVDEHAEMRLKIVLSRFGAHDVHYRIDAGILMPKGKDLQYARRLDCEACSDTEMVEMVSRYAASAAGWLHSSAARQEESEHDASNSPPSPPVQHEFARDRHKGLGQLGIAGVVLSTMGGVGVVSGATLIGLGTRDAVHPTDDTLLARQDFRTPGIPMLVAGGALVVTGLVLLVVDRSRPRRGAITAAPAWLPGGGGFAMTTRF